MKFKFVILFCCLDLMGCVTCFAGVKDKGALHQIAELLKQADHYAYTIDIHTDFQNKKDTSASEKSLETSCFYFSKSEYIQYLSSSEKSYLLCKQGYFNCDVVNNVVFYKTFANDSVFIDYYSQIEKVANPTIVDSLFFDQANIKSIRNKGAFTVYNLTYPKGSIIEKAELQFDKKNKQILSFSYRFSQTLEGDVAVTKTIHMHHYSSNPPANLMTILKSLSIGFDAFVKTKFASYTLKKLN